MAFGDADASTPAFVKANAAGKNATTASFTPPAGALLVACGWHDTAGGNLTNTSVITDSTGGTLTWAIRSTVSKQSDGTGFANGHLQVSTAVVPGGGVGSITVTTTGTNTNNPAAIYVRVVTGADTTTPMDITPVEGTNTNSAISQAISTVTDGARAFLIACDWNLAANMTAGTSQTAVAADGIGGPDMRVYLGVQNAVTSPAGSVTMSTASPTTGNTNNWSAFALRPAAGGSSTNANAENAGSTGAANAAAVDAQINAGNTTATGTANDAAAAASVNAEAIAATGAANTAAATVAVNAENASGSGAAFDATVSTATQTSANAETTTATGAANTSSIAAGPSADVATGTATANDASAAASPAAEATSGTAAAMDAQAAAATAAGSAAGSGAAFDASVSVTAEAELITAVAAAFAATVSDGDADARATSAPLVTAGRTSTAVVTDQCTSADAVTARATSSGGVT